MNEVNDQAHKDLEDARDPVVDEDPLARIEELRAKLDAADQSPLPRGPFPGDYKPRPDESTQEFMKRGLATEDAGEFLRKVGPIPMTEGFAHGIPEEDQIQPLSAPLGPWTIALDNRQLAEVRLARTYARDFAHGTAGHHRLMLIAQMADMLDHSEVPTPKPNPVLINRHVLDVQYHSQHEFDAKMTRRDCGPACIEMVGKYLRPAVDHSTDEIMIRITKGVDRSTYISELQKAALEMFQITLHRVEHCSMMQLRDWILDDLPVIILVHYGSFHTRLDRNYRVGHFMVVVGYEIIDYQGTPSMRFLVHDPDYYSVPANSDRLELFAQGAFIPVIEEHLHVMWSDAVKDRNPVRMALVPEIM
jgi:hypothetical protein